MKKIFLFSFLAITILSCKEEKNNETNSEIQIDKTENNKVSEKMTILEITDSLKKGEFATEFAKYSDTIVNKIAEKMSYSIAMDERGEIEYLKEITDFKNNVISLYWETGSTGGSMQHQKLQIKDNEIIDLGNGFDKLTESENLRLDNIIKSKVKNYSHLSGRNQSDIKIKENGNYLITFGGLTDDDSEASSGSLDITYETKDLKTFITNSVVVTERK